MLKPKLIGQTLKPDTVYVVAVSGGLDSVSLLDLLVRGRPSSSQLVVAHIDHGIRPNSAV